VQTNACQEGTEINTEVNERPLKNIGTDSQRLAQSSSSLTVPESQDEAGDWRLQRVYSIAMLLRLTAYSYYQDIFSVKFCAQCEYSKTCKPICVFCIWFCIVSVDPRLVIFAYLQVCEKVKKCLLFRLSQYGNPTHWVMYSVEWA